MRFGIAAFAIQWHITSACPNRCRHCYMYDEKTYAAERRNELSDRGLLQILDSIEEFEGKWGAAVNTFAITGGDPLARPNWLPFLEELGRRGKSIRLMGVPESLTERNVASLAELGIAHFQLSLDGLERTHDHIRGQGSFRRTVEALQRLSDSGIPANVMFTLNGENRSDLIPLLRFVATQTPAASFVFDLMSSVGNGAGMQNDLTAAELLELFTAYLDEQARLRDEGYSIAIREKPHLFKAMHLHRRNRRFPMASEPSIFSGCLVGWSCVAILADGTVLACRRMPIAAGKMPEQSFEEIFLGSEVLRRFRRPDSFEGCGGCEYFAFCRGCPSVVYGLTGNPFAPNPLCFKKNLGSAAPGRRPPVSYPPLDASNQEEYELVGRSLHNLFLSNVQEVLRDEDVARAILAHTGPEAHRRFAASPDAFCREHSLHLTELQRSFVDGFEAYLPEEAKSKIRRVLFRRLFR